MKTLLAILLCMGFATAHARPCTSRDAEAADQAVDSLTSWAAVDRNFRKYGHCDDGSIAEGNSDAIARLLVDHWLTLDKLGELTRNHLPLRAYVLRHIDSTLNTRDLEKIEHLASSNCPSTLNALCADLKAAAERAKR